MTYEEYFKQNPKARLIAKYMAAGMDKQAALDKRALSIGDLFGDISKALRAVKGKAQRAGKRISDAYQKGYHAWDRMEMYPGSHVTPEEAARMRESMQKLRGRLSAAGQIGREVGNAGRLVGRGMVNHPVLTGTLAATGIGIGANALKNDDNMNKKASLGSILKHIRGLFGRAQGKVLDANAELAAMRSAHPNPAVAKYVNSLKGNPLGGTGNVMQTGSSLVRDKAIKGMLNKAISAGGAVKRASAGQAKTGGYKWDSFVSSMPSPFAMTGKLVGMMAGTPSAEWMNKRDNDGFFGKVTSLLPGVAAYRQQRRAAYGRSQAAAPPAAARPTVPGGVMPRPSGSVPFYGPAMRKAGSVQIPATLRVMAHILDGHEDWIAKCAACCRKKGKCSTVEHKQLPGK